MLLLAAVPLWAQDPFEIHVYEYETLAPRSHCYNVDEEMMSTSGARGIKTTFPANNRSKK